jgi:SAM-dependent methyltransferase
MTDLRRYELFGFDYDRYNPPEPRATAWYLRWAGRTPGPVLELACGGGTLLLPLARAGHDVTGLDLANGMLARSRARLEVEPPEVRDRVHLVRGDMSDFDLGRRFALVILADNSLRELESREELLACFRCVRRHLAPGGRFLLTEARFFPELYAHGKRVWPETPEYEDPETGRVVARRIEVRWDREGRRLDGMMTYRVREPDGVERTVECPYRPPVVTPTEYRAMLLATGFEPTLFVGYEERPDDGEAPMLCFVSGAAPGEE